MVIVMKIKICGLKRDEDIEYINKYPPDFIGFVFTESKRRISREKACHLRRLIKADVQVVGVFADNEISMIKDLYNEKIIDIAQLHGSESDKYIEKLKMETNIKIIKAVRFGVDDYITYSKYDKADFLLFDNSCGGTGKAFDWSQIKKTDKPFFLAGGVNIYNFEEASLYNPYCIDISSGAETCGVKDADKIRKLVSIARTLS